MIPVSRTFQNLVVIVIASLFMSCGFAQKVRVDYDKSVDFSRYRSYTLQEPATPSPRPLLYASVVGSIRNELEAGGLASVDKDGDLIVILAGGLDYGLGSTSGVTSDSCKSCKAPLTDPMDLGRSTAPKGSAGKPMPNGMVELNFVDRATSKVVWAGVVTQKLDSDKRQKSLEQANKAIKKLLREFPPKSAGSK